MVEEKRSFPRAKSASPAKINSKISAQLFDLSEAGAGVSATDEIAAPAVTLEVDVPAEDFNFKAQARLVWRRDFAHEGFLYGFEFVDLTSEQKAMLRKEIIREQLKSLLENVDALETRRLIENFFLKDMLGCMEEIIRLNFLITKETRYSDVLAMRFEQVNNQIVLKGYCLDELLSQAQLSKKIRQSFRQLFGAWAYKSAVVRRALEKPRGYAGDYRLLEMIYDNRPVFSANIGYYYDRYFLKCPYAVALRSRKDRLKDTLAKFIADCKEEKINILSIGCGPSREIRELLPQWKSRKQVVFSCLDWDEEALLYSEEKLLPLKSGNMDFKFIKEDLVNLMSLESKKHITSRQHLIYSAGIADYLPNEEFKQLVASLCSFLQPGGKLVLTHKNREKTFPSVPPDWFCDWKFVSRNRDEVMRLIRDTGIPTTSLTFQSDDFGYIYYFTLTKQ